MSPVIIAEDLGKRYFLTHRNAAPALSIQDSFASGIAAAKARLLTWLPGNAFPATYIEPEEFWALSDVSFEVKQGEVLGIIGRNGAGKSTLLKVLSRITEPTTGRVELRGRVASLLEVGTGFHPELTGRENVFLNGAILGMSKVEIRKKFDEIVAFAEVEKFLDTPVKHYSSGMYVRLAFAVAAHLEPEILIVDEVLAVGDSDFQKKCLGKMKDVSSKDGRTVLFVTHNMGMISSLCSKALLLEHGQITHEGAVSDVLMTYYSRDGASPAAVDLTKGKVHGDEEVQALACYVSKESGEVSNEFAMNEAVVICLRFRIVKELTRGTSSTYPQVDLLSSRGEYIFQAMAPMSQLAQMHPGEYEAKCWIPRNFLNNEAYFVDVGMASCQKGVRVHFHLRNVLCFHVKENIEESLYLSRNGFSGALGGVIRPTLHWEMIPSDRSSKS